MPISSLVSVVAAHPGYGMAVFVVLTLPMVVLVLLVAVSTLVALFGSRERGGRAHRVLRDLLAALRRRGSRR